MFKFKNFIKIILKIANEIKDFLLKPKSKEFFLYMFFCGVATIFWFMLTLNENHKENFNVPVHITGIPSDLVLTNTPDSVLKLNVTARGTTILDFKIRKANNYTQPLELKFDSLKFISHKNHIQISTKYLQKVLNLRFKDAVSVDIMSPDSLEYIYAKSEGKRIPVRFIGSIEASGQHYIVDKIVSPDSVDVYAPSNILRLIKDVELGSSISVDNIAEDRIIRVEIPPIKGVKYLPNFIDLKVVVDAITEKTVQVPLVGINFPANKSLLTFPSEVAVTFQVGTKKFNLIDSSDFKIELAYEDLVKQEGNFPIKLTKVPEGVKHVRLSHKSVDFLIERKLNLTSHD